MAVDRAALLCGWQIDDETETQAIENASTAIGLGTKRRGELKRCKFYKVIGLSSKLFNYSVVNDFLYTFYLGTFKFSWKKLKKKNKTSGESNNTKNNKIRIHLSLVDNNILICIHAFKICNFC